MIKTKEVQIRKKTEFSSEYIETELNKMDLDVLRWSITNFNNDFYTLSLAVVEN